MVLIIEHGEAEGLPVGVCSGGGAGGGGRWGSSFPLPGRTGVSQLVNI